MKKPAWLINPLDNSNLDERLSQMSRASDLVWLTGSAAGVGLTLVAAYGFHFPMSFSGKFFAYASLLIRASLYLWAGERLADRGGIVLARLMKMGLVAGAVEILIDWWLVVGLRHGALVYMTGPDVTLLGSPIWMPVAWACVIVELGYPALRLYAAWKEKRGRGFALMASSIVVALAAGVSVGFYEYFANRAGWWRYKPANAMMGQTCALFIPLGEVFMFLPIVPIAGHAVAEEERPWAAALESGWIFAAAIFAGYGLAYLLLEAGRPIVR